jgi:hypothetical protein
MNLIDTLPESIQTIQTIQTIQANQANKAELCPFLGMLTDPQTAMSYPSSWNVCHHARPGASPRPQVQRLLCFSGQHSDCPVFTCAELAALPAGMRWPQPRRSFKLKVALPVFLAGLVIILLLVAIL